MKVNYISDRDSSINNLKNIYNSIDNLFIGYDHIYVSIDLDGFSSSHAPGVSAPSPFGFSTDFFKHVFKYILKTKKVIAIDVVELNPIYDNDSITAKLASQIIHMAVTR